MGDSTRPHILGKDFALDTQHPDKGNPLRIIGVELRHDRHDRHDLVGMSQEEFFMHGMDVTIEDYRPVYTHQIVVTIHTSRGDRQAAIQL